MNNLKAKLKKQGGFTLIEMLIVVAIIAILIAIAIPMVNKALESSREATDAANERGALGIAMVEVLSEGKLGGKAPDSTNTTIYAEYIIEDNNGYLGTGSTTDIDPGTKPGYGKGTKAAGSLGVTDSHVGQVIVVVYDSTKADKDAFTTKWVDGTT